MLNSARFAKLLPQLVCLIFLVPSASAQSRKIYRPAFPALRRPFTATFVCTTEYRGFPDKLKPEISRGGTIPKGVLHLPSPVVYQFELAVTAAIIPARTRTGCGKLRNLYKSGKSILK